MLFEIIIIVVVLLLITYSIFLYFGKGGFFLSSWNGMSETERGQFNKELLFKFFSKIMFLVSISIGLIMFGILKEWYICIIIGSIILLFAIIASSVAMLKKNSKYRK